MKKYLWIVPLLLALPASACGDMEDIEQETEEQVAEAEQTLATRYCSSSLDCRSSCECINGQCQPDGFGPPPEGEGYCAVPPQRACTTSAGCRSGCVCNGGYCQESFGPYVEGDYCARPLPDAYEDDNASQSAAGYLGSPQTGHNFHDLGDEDWVVVYFASAGQAKFETYDLVGWADTHLEVYSYNFGTGSAGQLVASNNDVCGIWYHLPCKASKVTLNVQANSAYFVRVRNLADAAHNVYNETAPGYSLKIYY
jgi:hypothetical protein